MIITVTTNPSIDRTIDISSLNLGEVNRGDLTSLDPGGKGVNVSRALAVYGAKTFAILVCGDLGKQWFAKKLNELQIQHYVIPADGITRSNITLAESNGTITKINEPGFELNRDTFNQVLETLEGLELKGSWVVLAGRLNPGADFNTYRDIARFVRDRGAFIAIDGSGAEFRAAITAKPDLIKPNQFELAELVGRELKTINDVILAAREIIEIGVKQVLCSLGKDGAILITRDEIIHCESEKNEVGTPVGAGDILLAIYLGGGANRNALKEAIAWSAASISLPGTAIPTVENVAQIKVIINELQVTRELAEVH